MIKNIIKKVLAHRQVVQAQKDISQRRLNNRIQRDLIIKGLEERA